MQFGILKLVEVRAAHPFAQIAKGWGTHSGNNVGKEL